MRDLKIKDLYKINKKIINDLTINYESSADMDEDIYYDELKYNYDNYDYEYISTNEKIVDKVCEFLREEIFRDNFLLEECRTYLNDIYDNSELYNLFKSGILEDIFNDFGIDISVGYSNKYGNYKLIKNYINNSYCNLDENYYGDAKKVVWNCPNCLKQNTTIINFAFRDKFIKCNCGFKTNESQVYKTKAEILIEKLLKKHNLNYEKQYKVYCCESNKPLKYDFKVEHEGERYYIEVNGLHHYIPINYFGGVKTFNKYKKKYKVKKKYAEETGVFIELDYRESNLGLLRDRFYNNFYYKHINNKEVCNEYK